MKQRTLGKSGLQVSEVGLGCWQLGGAFGPLDDQRAESILFEAQERQINFWDTADVYGAGQSELRIGRWLRDHAGTGQRPVIATKVGRSAELYPNGYTKEKVRSSLEGSLRRLGGDALDLAQLHCVPFKVLRAGDILAWMEDFQQSGLIRHFGASVETVEEGLFCLGHPGIASLQIIFSLFRQDAVPELLPQAEAADVGIIVRLPLASGLLGGKMTANEEFSENDHRRYNRDGQRFNVGETFSGLPFETGVQLAENVRRKLPTDHAMGQWALRWILDHPQVSTIIAGTSRPSQVAENAATSGLPPLSPELHSELSKFYTEEVRPNVRGPI
jgi:aryl-alcohol dehydrogenase-like predicted oxidoreductase